MMFYVHFIFMAVEISHYPQPAFLNNCAVYSQTEALILSKGTNLMFKSEIVCYAI